MTRVVCTIKSRARLAFLLIPTLAVGIAINGGSAAQAVPNPSPGSVDTAKNARMSPPSYVVAKASSDWVPTPGGLTYRTCVHEIPDGAMVSPDGVVTLNGVTVSKTPPCPYSGVVREPEEADAQPGPASPASAGIDVAEPPAMSSGWWLDSWWTSSAEIVSLSAVWTVPAKPAKNGALIYFFPSVEPADGSAIVQPVLQYGVSPAGGGNYWALANWFVSSGDSYHGPLEITAPGHKIKGTMKRASGSDDRWEISFVDPLVSGPAKVSLATGFKSLRAVQGGVLEVYHISSCRQLPKASSVTFSSISVASTSGRVTPSFSKNKRVTSCSSSVTATRTTPKLGWRAS